MRENDKGKGCEDPSYRNYGDVIQVDAAVINKIAQIIARPGEIWARAWGEAPRLDGQRARSFGGEFKYSSPVRDFEKRVGVKGISRQWKMPRGRSYEDTQKMIYPHICAVVNSQEPASGFMSQFAVVAFFDELGRLNPDFTPSPVIAQSLVLRAHAVYGAISQFNLSDISHYCLNPDAEPSVDPMGYPVGFVMSPATERKVRDYFENEFFASSRPLGTRRARRELHSSAG